MSKLSSKNNFDLFKKKIEGDAKTSKKKLEKYLFSLVMNVFFENRQQSNKRWAEKNTIFFGNARPKSNARAHLKQIKRHSGLMLLEMICVFKHPDMQRFCHKLNKFA